MTSVRLTRQGARYTVAAKGHATGSPETCAAVSMMMFSAAGWLHNTGDAALLRERLEPGDAALTFTGGSEARAVFELLYVGFLQLAAARPETVTVEFSEK